MGEMGVSRVANVPPKQSELVREVDQRVAGRMEAVGAKPCPAAEVCKGVGNYYPGTCNEDPTDVARRRCQVSMVLLLGKK